MYERFFSTLFFFLLLIDSFSRVTSARGNPVPEDDLSLEREELLRRKRGGIDLSFPKVQKPQESFQVAEGDSVTVPCNILLNIFDTVLWYKGVGPDRTLLIDEKANEELSDPDYSVTDDHSLVIRQVTQKTVGTYMCYVNSETNTTHIIKLKSTTTGAATTKSYANICILVIVLGIMVGLCR